MVVFGPSYGLRRIAGRLPQAPGYDAWRLRLANDRQAHECQYSPECAFLTPAHLMLPLSLLAWRPPHVQSLPPGTGSNAHTQK
jgi:hypothetical protein